MRSSILILTTAAVFVASSAPPAHAQAALPTNLVINVPFAFSHSSNSMPAGRYEVASGVGGSLWIKTGGKTAISLFRSRTVKPDAKGRLRFDCYGETNKCFLRQVIAPGSDVALTFSVSKEEKEYMHAEEPRVAYVFVESHASTSSAE